VARNGGWPYSLRVPAIEARGLRREFRPPFRSRSVVAVDGLDLSIEPGRVFGLLGPNGSGKTTTILMMLGLLKPTAGTVRVLGHPAGHREARRRTGFLPEETRLYEFLSGEETLDFVGQLFGIPRAERKRRTHELLEMTGMWEARKRKLATYSKGMARRIGLAQSLIAEPEKDLLREVAAKGTTVLTTSHILGDVADVCDEILILHRGRPILAGDVSDLLADAQRLAWESDTVAPEARARIEAAFRAEGAELHTVSAPATTLEALFLDALAKDQEARPDAGGA